MTNEDFERAVRQGDYRQLDLDDAREAYARDLEVLQRSGWDEAAVAKLDPSTLREEHP